MSDPVEFRVRAWQRPVRVWLLVLDAVLLGAPAAAVAHFAFALSPALSLLAGAPFAFGVVALILWKDNRPVPEGALRLLPDRLVWSGDPGAPVEIAVSQLRDVAADPLSPALLIRDKSGRRIAIPRARIDVTLPELMQAITAWIDASRPDIGAAFAAERQRRQRTQAILSWVVLASAVLAVVRLLVLLVGG